MKIKYVAGKKANQVVEIDDAQAKSLIEDGVAEAVAEEVDALDTAIKGFEQKINDTLEGAVAKLAKGVAAVKPVIRVGPDNVENDPQAGFKSFGEYASAVIKHSIGNGTDERLKPLMKSTTGNTSGGAPDAGPTVPVQYTNEIFKVTGSAPDFFGMTFQVPTATNAIKIPVLKNYNRANTTAGNGVVANVISEAAAITQSKSNWEQLSLSLASLKVLVPVSNELLEDNIVSLDAILAEHSAYQIRKGLNGAIVKGSPAVGTGIIDHAATKPIQRASANSVSFNDVLGMYAAFAHDDADYSNAVWLVNPTVLPKLGAMTSGNYNIYIPAGGATNQQFATLLGRPIIVTGHASALGTAGDVLLVDFKKYVTAYKGGINSAMSVHLFFNTDESAFRYTIRVAGKPGLSGPITLEDGSTTVSPFVQLDDPAA